LEKKREISIHGRPRHVNKVNKEQRGKKLELLKSLCRERAIPVTVQRKVVLSALVERDDHPTVDQVFEDVKARMPGVSRTTVYRVLETLVELGMAKKTKHFESAARFDGNTDDHHHLVCTRCNAVVDFEDPKLRGIRLPDTRRTGFEITDLSIYFEGRCAECKHAATARPIKKSRRKLSRGHNKDGLAL
jgi:Fur family peroxide stress response transcriptional regulator